MTTDSSEFTIEQVQEEAESFSECWTRSREARVGKRFMKLHRLRRREEARRPKWVPIVSVILSIILLGLGIFFTFVPGPNWFFFIPAFCLLAAEFGMAARFLDLGEKAVQPLVKAVRKTRSKLPKPVWVGLNLIVALSFLYLTYSVVTS